jgi:hypothetical protein
MTATVTPIRDAKVDAASARWKFDFLDTVNADPLCKPACLKVIKAYLTFASEGAPVAFMARSEISLRTGLADATIKRTHRLLVKLGYLQRLNKTKGGAIQYRLVNARQALIADHIVFGREKLADDMREKRRLEKAMKGLKMSPLNSAGADQNEPPMGIKMSPNSLENTLELIAKNTELSLIGAHGSFADPVVNGPSSPIPAPETSAEADATLQQIVQGKDVPAYVVNALGLMLGKGTLTLEKASRLIRQYEEVAA